MKRADQVPWSDDHNDEHRVGEVSRVGEVVHCSRNGQKQGQLVCSWATIQQRRFLAVPIQLYCLRVYSSAMEMLRATATSSLQGRPYFEKGEDKRRARAITKDWCSFLNVV